MSGGESARAGREGLGKERPRIESDGERDETRQRGAVLFTQQVVVVFWFGLKS